MTYTLNAPDYRPGAMGDWASDTFATEAEAHAMARELNAGIYSITAPNGTVANWDWDGYGEPGFAGNEYPSSAPTVHTAGATVTYVCEYQTTVSHDSHTVTIGGYDGATSDTFATLTPQQVAHFIAQLSGALAGMVSVSAPDEVWLAPDAPTLPGIRVSAVTRVELDPADTGVITMFGVEFHAPEVSA
jgi:hypothetical protein